MKKHHQPFLTADWTAKQCPETEQSQGTVCANMEEAELTLAEQKTSENVTRQSTTAKLNYESGNDLHIRNGEDDFVHRVQQVNDLKEQDAEITFNNRKIQLLSRSFISCGKLCYKYCTCYSRIKLFILAILII